MEFSSIALPTAYNRIRDFPFAANLASLPHLPINTSYASSTSINISGVIFSELTIILLSKLLHVCRL